MALVFGQPRRTTMKISRLIASVGCAAFLLVTHGDAFQTTAAADRQAEAGRFPARPFLRQNLDKLTWTATEGNKLGVQTAVLEGDPSKPGFYLIINRFP